MAGRSPTGPGSRPADRAADGVSPVPASIPNAKWVTWGGLPAPAGGAEWLSEIRRLHADTALLHGFPDGHVIKGDEHLLVIRQCEAQRFFERNYAEVTDGLLRALDAAQAIEARRAETLQDGSVHESAVGNADAPNPGQSSGMPKGGEL